MMLPEEFTSRIKSQKYIDSQTLLQALNEPAPVSIRINKAKWSATPETGQQVQWCLEGFYLNNRPSFTFDPLFHAGCYYPQEASSMFIGEVFRQLKSGLQGIRVLDLCGAPGGKSTHISSILGSSGFLVANEVIRQRAAVLTENLVKWGGANWIVTRSDPSSFSGLQEFFDIILVDAPCSGEGMFRDEIARNEWSVENTSLCSSRQRRILLDVWPALKENGILIYSTCTFNPAENEQNIKWLSEDKSAFPVSIDVSGFKGITSVEHEGVTGYGFYPGKIKGDGLFVSIIRKTVSELGISRPGKTIKIKSVGSINNDLIHQWTYADESKLFSNGSEVWSLPCSSEEFSQLASKLEIAKPGTALLTVKGKDAIPAHDLALSRLLKPDAFETADLNFSSALKYLRKETPDVMGISGKWAIAKYQGVSLGFMKNVGNRINNYYPVEYRIRMSTNKGEDDIIRWKRQDKDN